MGPITDPLPVLVRSTGRVAAQTGIPDFLEAVRRAAVAMAVEVKPLKPDRRFVQEHEAFLLSTSVRHEWFHSF